MKKNLQLLVLCIFISVAATAQIARGTVLLGGTLSGSTYRQQFDNPADRTGRNLSFAPAIGLFVRENLAIGINTGWNSSKDEGDAYTQTNRGAQLQLFARKYRSLGKGFYLFGEGGAGYSRNRQENLTPERNMEEIRKTFSVYLYPGVSYAVSRKLQLEASLNNLLRIDYTDSRTGITTPLSEGGSRLRDFSFNSGIGNNIPINLGFRLFLGK